MSLEQIKKVIADHRRFAVTTHRNPEPDAVGSSLALAHFLRELGKESGVVLYDPVPQNLRFLPHQTILRQESVMSNPIDVLFVLDCGDLERTGFFNGQHPSNLMVVNIDHHITNREFGEVNWVNHDAAATGEMIYDLLMSLGKKPSDPVALCIYTSIAGETGFFSYSNTKPKTFRLVANLVEQGVDPWMVSQHLKENSIKRLQLLSLVLKSLKCSRDGRLAWITVTQDHLSRTEATSEDTEDFINYPRFLWGVEAAILFREVEGNQVKVSFRSKNYLDVARLAYQFGGGGHQRASGCTIGGSLKEVRRSVLKALKKAIKDHD